MELPMLLVIAILGYLPSCTDGNGDELFLLTPRILAQRMIDEAFDEELRNITSGRSQRSLMNEVDQNECTDNLGTSQCRYLRDFGSCYRADMSATMKTMCKKTCGFCRGKEYRCHASRYGCCPGSQSAAKGPNMEGCKDSCVDIYGQRFCKVAKKMKMCVTGKNQLFKGCLKTCGFCRPCKDIIPLKCKIASKFKACQTLKKTTINYCRETCGFCGKNDPCFGFTCEDPKQCVVGPDGRPTCMCKRNCNIGDEYTGKLCGRDGLEYKNICHLKQAFCKSGSEIFAKHFGACNKEQEMNRLLNCAAQSDVYNCPTLVMVGACKWSKQKMMQLCPHACGFCSKKYAAPKPPCYYSKYGCCMDGVTTCSGPGYEGCPTCKDKLKNLCKRFVPACGDDLNGSFMKKNCARQCQYCRSSS